MTGPTPQLSQMEALIDKASVQFWTPKGTTVTCCALVLESGFTVLGKSVCPDPALFNPETGARLAFADACAELERMEAYRQAMSPRIALATPLDVMAMKANG